MQGAKLRKLGCLELLTVILANLHGDTRSTIMCNHAYVRNTVVTNDCENETLPRSCNPS